MAAHTSILLLAALCVGSAYSLKCYTCTEQTSNSNCMTATTCSSGYGYCMTAVGTASANGVTATVITKTCETSCTPTTVTVSGATGTVTCCSSDLCNTSGAISIKSSYAAIFLVLGIILMFFSDSLF